ncbi:efflux RND transporter periplasmic adaptor subunit [Priestia flexa]|uniref:efflux RND transporter periplasmic adaptor subunit n=1 Tax=Priestia flexa TaxID=86664 RepID=UPI001C95A5DD|nr:efflux RND transporter periplasmic adaptor subunit [Priestia flexa]MBY6086613.1 efflux RND transporter periplasmic adaptor subunit [Priestia flexa]WEZ08186.1 efflux RND transporter periplasmic adaptor subunit [Priestia flexa]
MKILQLSAVATVLLLAACAPQEITTEDTKDNIPVVETAKVSKSDLVNTTELSGVAMPSKQVPIVTANPLNVEKVHVKVGDTVQKGDLLVSLDASEATKQLNEARQAAADISKAVKEAEAKATPDQSQEIKQAQKELEASMNKSESLLEEAQNGDVTSSDLVQSGLEISLNQAKLAQKSLSQISLTPDMLPQLKQQQQQANQAVAQAEQIVASTRLTAPISGTIADVSAVENGIAAPSTPLMTVIDQSNVDATFQVNSYQVSQLKAGNQIKLTFDGVTQEFTSKISTVSPTANPETGLFTVKAPIENAKSQVKGGMKATGEVTIDSLSDALVIPSSAISYDEEQAYVYIVNGKKAVKTPITLGFANDDQYQVVDGLKADDVIVTDGKDQIQDGNEVKQRASEKQDENS